eukprot:2263614-Pleurochrysis_carterae.AAC.9
MPRAKSIYLTCGTQQRHPSQSRHNAHHLSYCSAGWHASLLPLCKTAQSTTGWTLRFTSLSKSPKSNFPESASLKPICRSLNLLAFLVATSEAETSGKCWMRNPSSRAEKEKLFASADKDSSQQSGNDNEWTTQFNGKGTASSSGLHKSACTLYPT